MKVGHWHRAEFEDLLASEEEPFGKVYACHKHVGLEPGRRGMCAGWLLDQKKRNVPSIMLRLQLSQSPEALEAYEAVNDGGHPLYRDVAAMCRANGVKPTAQQLLKLRVRR